MIYITKSLDAVKNGIESDLERYKALATAWENVTIRTKKDGKEFENIARAVDGAKVVKKSYCDEKEIRVWLYDVPKNKMYIDDSLDLYGFDTTNHGYRKYELSADEMRAKIAKHIEDLKTWADECITALETIDEDYNEYVKAIETANAIATKHGDRSKTYYALYDLAK